MSGRRGFVLVVVLFALVLLAAMASGAFFEALQEARIGRNVAQDVTLRAAAESGITRVLASWDPRLMDSLSTGVMHLAGVSGAGVNGEVEVRRLDERLMLLRSRASDQDGIERSVELVVRLVGPELGGAALKARSADPVAILRADIVDLEPSASDSAFYRFGAMGWSQLVAWAEAVPAGGDSLPVSYRRGNFVMTGGRFTGTLIVDGDLQLGGSAAVSGLLIVHGRLIVGPGGADIQGAAFASQVIVDQSVMPQDLAFRCSASGALRAGLSRAAATPLKGVPAWGVF